MSFLGLLSGLAGFVKVRYLVDKAIIDNIVFRCHYRVTSAILFLCCIIVTANNLIGDPINCINDGAVQTHVINTFCWITYTFTLPHQQGQGRRPPSIVHPGLGNYVEEEDAPRYHSYYQWVPFMLFFQGILFYLPHWIWKNWEEGKVRMISDGMRGVVIGPKENRHGKVARLVQYIEDTLHMHNFYAAGYFLCEALNFANVVGNIFFVDTFLGGAFLTYGTDVIKFSGLNQENRTDPMVEVFPRMTKCTFHKFGSSGSIQKHDALCVLALNILNEKIYIFLWFWFIILAVISGLALLYSSALVVLPSVRELVLKWHFRMGTPAGVSVITRKTQIGDFLLLHLLSQNMNMMVYDEVLNELCNKPYSERSNSDIPTAPSTMELSPIYPTSKLSKLERETET